MGSRLHVFPQTVQCLHCHVKMAWGTHVCVKYLMLENWHSVRWDIFLSPSGITKLERFEIYVKDCIAKHNCKCGWESLFSSVQVCIPRLILWSCNIYYILLHSSLQWCLPTVPTAFFCPCVIFLLLLQPIIEASVLLWKPLSFHQFCFYYADKGISKAREKNVLLILLLFLKPAFLPQMFSAVTYSGINIVFWVLLPSQYISGE